MDRETAIALLNNLRTFAEEDDEPAIDMAIEALSAEQKEEELANDIARRIATIIENEQDMRVILKNASAEDEQGVGRYENAMQKLRDMPRYLNGVKEKQITKISTNCTTEKPNGVVEQKNDVVAEPTDLISRADAIKAIESRQTEQWIDADVDYNNGLESAVAEIKALPSADRPTELLDDGTLKVNVQNGAEASRVLVWGDDGCGGLYYADDRPSGEWVEKEVIVDEDTNITEWQSAKCSVCGKYHTTPYMYYFDSFNYCPNCGAKMGGSK